MLDYILETVIKDTVTLQSLALSTTTSIILGFIISYFYSIKEICYKSFSISLALIQIIVQILIIMFNINI